MLNFKWDWNVEIEVKYRNCRAKVSITEVHSKNWTPCIFQSERRWNNINRSFLIPLWIMNSSIGPNGCTIKVWTWWLVQWIIHCSGRGFCKSAPWAFVQCAFVTLPIVPAARKYLSSGLDYNFINFECRFTLLLWTTSNAQSPQL